MDGINNLHKHSLCFPVSRGLIGLSRGEKNERKEREISAGPSRVLFCSRRPDLLSKLTGF